MTTIYPHSRPDLTIERTGSKELGRSWHKIFYKVTSTRQLVRDELLALEKAGVLGHGQGFGMVFVTAEGKDAPVPEKISYVNRVEPTSYDLVDPVEIDDYTKQPTGRQPINRWSGKPYEPSKQPVWVYTVTREIDSGD